MEGALALLKVTGCAPLRGATCLAAASAMLLAAGLVVAVVATRFAASALCERVQGWIRATSQCIRQILNDALITL